MIKTEREKLGGGGGEGGGRGDGEEKGVWGWREGGVWGEGVLFALWLDVPVSVYCGLDFSLICNLSVWQNIQLSK